MYLLIKGAGLVESYSLFSLSESANSVDPNQLPQVAASDLGQYCFLCPIGTLDIHGLKVDFGSTVSA